MALLDADVMEHNVTWQPGRVTRAGRREVVGRGATVWLTGLSGAGKSTIASLLEERLMAAGHAAYMLDGDNLRHGLNGDLGFDAASRSENVRRTAHVASLFADAGLIALVGLISPYRADRELAREVHAALGIPFVEVFVDTALAECERRDTKGLYAKARAGELRGLTGVDAPYERPEKAEVVIRTPEVAPCDGVGMVLAALCVEMPRD